MTRHLLMDPAFPDIVGEWAKHEARSEAKSAECANDNETEHDDLSELMLALAARAEVEATRLW
jgi:hypothetical protein